MQKNKKYEQNTAGYAAFIVVSFILLYGMLGTAEAATKPSLHYQFMVPGTLEETGSMSESSSPYFWLNSGGALIIKDNIGKTIQGKLPADNPWRILYNASNALDTSNGLYPQNLFRLVTKSKWNNFEQSLRFNVAGLTLTDTPNRDGYSGVLLMSRYQDGNNLYYAGIRDDGTSVIKKKYKGTYYTLASGKVFSSSKPYDRITNPSLIPEDQWMKLKTTVVTQSDGSVKIELWIDRKDNGTWEKLLSTTDIPGKNGSDVVKGSAYAGIRTDYKNVLFDDYKLTEL